jgi:hypothetical protein
MSGDEQITIPKEQFIALLNIYHALQYNLPQERVQAHVEAYQRQFDRDSGE